MMFTLSREYTNLHYSAALLKHSIVTMELLKIYYIYLDPVPEMYLLKIRMSITQFYRMIKLHLMLQKYSLKTLKMTKTCPYIRPVMCCWIQNSIYNICTYVLCAHVLLDPEFHITTYVRMYCAHMCCWIQNSI